MCVYIYIYICVEREICTHMCVYIHVYNYIISTCVNYHAGSDTGRATR